MNKNAVEVIIQYHVLEVKRHTCRELWMLMVCAGLCVCVCVCVCVCLNAAARCDM